MTVNEEGISASKEVKVDFSRDAHITQHHHSPYLSPLPRVKRSRDCMVPNIQRCETLVETGLSASSAVEKLTD